ncbi:MAG: four helix bundle protein [Desulfurivibrionaceae bacterium]
MEQIMKRSNEEFARELERRTRQFAVGIIRLSGMLPMSPEGKVLRNQITKSGTSIGANYRELSPWAFENGADARRQRC